MITNKRQTLMRLSAIFACLFILATCYDLFLKLQDDQIRETIGSGRNHVVRNLTEFTKKSKVAPPFVFLTQAEQCLTPGLIQTLELSDASKCRCDVIVLSYKTECLEKSAPHITYWFGNETTSDAGRNKLYFYAMQRKLDYLYYIFLDDDITLEFSREATPEMMRLTPISVFQDWLLDYEPAVGVGDCEEHDGSKRLHWRPPTADKRNTKPTNPAMILFRPMFSAFHTKAVSHIFPMENSHENCDWWLTDRYVASVAGLKFGGQALMFCPLAVGNLLHRPYPRSSYGNDKASQRFNDSIQEKAPSRYKYNALIRTSRRSPRAYIKRSGTSYRPYRYAVKSKSSPRGYIKDRRHVVRAELVT